MPAATSDATPAALARALEQFLAERPRAAVLEDGRVLFDMSAAHYSLSAEHGRCVLHLWSEDRNMVRTVTGLEVRKDSLRLQTQRFGQARSQTLQLVEDRDRRTPSTRTVTRTKYLRLLERVFAHSFPEYRADGLRSAMDLEHSFGPAYARGLLLRGSAARAVIGVNAAETPATIDGVLTLGILWLAYCREHSGGRRVLEGLSVIVPRGSAERTRARMAWLNPALAQWRLFELDEESEELRPVEICDGNLDMRLAQAFNAQAALDRCPSSIERLLGLLPASAREQVEVRARGPAEVAFLLHGLEFARARQGFAPNSFAREEQLSFGAGANETPLTEETEGWFRELFARLFASRRPEGSPRDPLYRLQSERWMECALKRDLSVVDPGIQTDFLYQQVPAFSGGDRGMLDLLTVNRQGRLMVIELKADEDLHLPLQGLDYWLRVRWLNQQGRDREPRGELERHGYFPGLELSPLPPLLCLVAPALRIHPTNEIVLKHFSREIEWTLIALGENWREQPAVVFRKRGGPGV